MVTQTQTVEQSAAGQIAALRAEVARLRDENARLRAALAALVDALGDGETGEGYGERCVACQVRIIESPTYEAAEERVRERARWRDRLKALGVECDEAEAQVNAQYPLLDPGDIPHRDPCPLQAARDVLAVLFPRAMDE